jgi:hypothetical protein
MGQAAIMQINGTMFMGWLAIKRLILAHTHYGLRPSYLLASISTCIANVMGFTCFPVDPRTLPVFSFLSGTRGHVDPTLLGPTGDKVSVAGAQLVGHNAGLLFGLLLTLREVFKVRRTGRG